MLRRIPALLLGSTLLLLPVQTLTAQASLSVAGGVAAPMGDFGDVADMGYNVGIGLNFGGTRRPVGARIEGGLNGFGIKDLDANVRILTGTANAIVNFSQNADSPYLIGGLGIYNTKFEDFDADNSAGINIGGGLRFPLGTLSTFLEMRYHSTLSDDRDGGRIQFIPITFGIAF